MKCPHCMALSLHANHLPAGPMHLTATHRRGEGPTMAVVQPANLPGTAKVVAAACLPSISFASAPD